MNLYDLIYLPVFWGLIGFIEPCSVGINTLFLAHVQYAKKQNIFREIIIFTLVRGLTLAVLGYLIALIGTQLFVVVRGSYLAFGLFYIVIGLAVILSKHFPVMKNVNLHNLVGENRKTAHLGVIFGLIIPACALPFIFVLLGKAIIFQSALSGFLSLFIFAVTLSLPLFLFGLTKGGIKALAWIGARLGRIPYLVGTLFILIGIITVWSNVWWV